MHKAILNTLITGLIAFSVLPSRGSCAASLEPEVFIPKHISLPGSFEHTCSLAPTGKEILFSRERGQIMHLQKTDDGWGQATLWRPGRGAVYSCDGNEVYYEQGGDLYRVRREAAGWSAPVKLPTPINSPRYEYVSSLTKEGTLYFFRVDGDSITRLYRATAPRNGYREAKPCPLTSDPKRYPVYHATVDPNEQFIVFDIDEGPGGQGANDLYVARRTGEGRWGSPVHLGNQINTPQVEASPTLSPDGRQLFFTRCKPDQYGREGDVWVVSTALIHQALF